MKTHIPPYLQLVVFFRSYRRKTIFWPSSDLNIRAIHPSIITFAFLIVPTDFGVSYIEITVLPKYWFPCNNQVQKASTSKVIAGCLPHSISIFFTILQILRTVQHNPKLQYLYHHQCYRDIWYTKTFAILLHWCQYTYHHYPTSIAQVLSLQNFLPKSSYLVILAYFRWKTSWGGGAVTSDLTNGSENFNWEKSSFCQVLKRKFSNFPYHIPFKSYTSAKA